MGAKDFEKKLQRLEKIVEELDSGDISLEKAMKLFAEGVELTHYCYRILDEAEQQLQILTDSEQTDAGEQEE